MKNLLTVAALQTDLIWENSSQNLQRMDAKINDMQSIPDFIVLPEMFNTGFTMRANSQAQTMDGNAVNWLREKSSQTGAAICGSVIITEDHKYYNRFLWVEAGVVKSFYDKRHLFRMAGEDAHYASGKNHPIIDFKGWKIMPRICYDLRFPVWNRSSEVDLQIYVASWPAARVSAWTTLLKARAIENQCYTMGVNRIGKDGNGIEFNGKSLVVDPKGIEMTDVDYEDDGFIYATLDYEELIRFRQKFPVSKDADSFQIHF